MSMSFIINLTMYWLIILPIVITTQLLPEDAFKQNAKPVTLIQLLQRSWLNTVFEQKAQQHTATTKTQTDVKVLKFEQTQLQSINEQNCVSERKCKLTKAPNIKLVLENTVTGVEAIKNHRKRYVSQLKNSGELLGLPTRPVPVPPPPISASIPMSPFSRNSTRHKPLSMNAFSNANLATSPILSSGKQCGGTFKARHGIIKTPNFPHKFDVPLECLWVIDASEVPIRSSAASNISIIVYFTQLYVLSGLKFTEYMYYSDDFKVPAHRIFQLTEDDATQVAWIQFHSQYLEIRFSIPTLEGTHLRALDHLLDVYGFNITYEVQQHIKPNPCNTLQCRFLGNCMAQADYSSYACDCYSGFSGNDCGHGPLCDDPHTNICQNGGKCKQIGDAAITCHCPVGYKGTKCEIPDIKEITKGCTINSTLSNCHRDCEFDQPFIPASTVNTDRHSGRTGMTRYEVTIRLSASLPGFYRKTEKEYRSNDYLPMVLEKHLIRVLRNFNVTRVSDLEVISNLTDRLDITFHFFGVNIDSTPIRDAITRMVERGRIGNITLVSNYHRFQENPPLDLMDMSVNKQTIREESEFIVSCRAQGSSRMQFQWFQNGAFINASKAIREIWTTVLPPETKNVYTAILGIRKANTIDEGIYTCKVIDWGVEQCRSLHIHIKSPPRLRVDPASVTLFKGDSLRVRCLSPGNDNIKRSSKLGYSWTRNNVLFQADPNTIMWEDLYPDGSILKINNIQKSAEFTCVVSNPVKPVSKSVYITVVDQNAVHVCEEETLYYVHWPNSAPGSAIIAECPHGYEGYTRRVCEKRDAGSSRWLLPDFSNCIHDQLLPIYKKFQALTSGYQQTDTSTILKYCFDYITERNHTFFPGEAGFLIDILNELDTYLQSKGSQLEREMAAEIVLHILDAVMQSAQSLNSQHHIKKFQLLTQSAALNCETTAASQFSTSTAAVASTSIKNVTATLSTAVGITSSTATLIASPISDTSSSVDFSSSEGILIKTNSDRKNRSTNIASSGVNNTISFLDDDLLSFNRLNSLRIYMTSVKTLPFNLRIYGNDLFSDQLYMNIDLSAQLLNIMANAAIFTTVISYKNLKSFLPNTYYTHGTDPQDNDYILASRIIQIGLFQSNRSSEVFREPLDLPFEAGHVEIIFQHERTPVHSDWTAVCGHDYKASFQSTWRSDLCITKHLMANVTRCICPLSGTYVVMLTKRNHNSLPFSTPQHPIFVIFSCICCFLQSSSAFLIMLPIWFKRKCAITFLKMQFCISASNTMIIFTLGFLKVLPMHWHAIISTALASLLLLGISTLIAIALVIHTELVQKMYIQHINKRPETETNASAIQNNSMKQDEGLAQNHNLTTSIISITPVNSSIAHIESNSNFRGETTKSAITVTHRIQLPSGIHGAIGISWLLPLLFAITTFLIFNIIGKWPQHWWLHMLISPPPSNVGSALVTTTTRAASHDFFDNQEPSVEELNVTKNSTSSFSASVEIISTVPDPASNNILHTDVYNLPTTITTSETLKTTATSPRITSNHTPYALLSLNFSLFLGIDAVFVMLFLALFIILIKKLFWIWRKQRNVFTHPMDNFNIEMRRRVGLMYRIGYLLITKLCVDGLFIAYVNTIPNQFWGYPFGVSCILMGCLILFCFVVKPEANLRNDTFLHSLSTKHSTSTKKKLSPSKLILNGTYRRESVNTPLKFYTEQESKRESKSSVLSPPLSQHMQQHMTVIHSNQQHLRISKTNGQMILTFISVAPGCQMLPNIMRDGCDKSFPRQVSNQEKFVGGNKFEHKIIQSFQTNGLSEDMQQHERQEVKKISKPAASRTLTLPATHCGEILGVEGCMIQTPDTTDSDINADFTFYNAYEIASMTNSPGRRRMYQQTPPHIRHEGFETSYILQDLESGTIQDTAPQSHELRQYRAHHHHPYVDTHTFVKIPSQLSTTKQTETFTNDGLTTTYVTAKTPNTQKRVTIIEPRSHKSFDSMVPTTAATQHPQNPQAQHQKRLNKTHATSTFPLTPKISVTTSSIDETGDVALFETDATALNGMYDRIGHDLDFLLNRKNDLPNSCKIEDLNFLLSPNITTLTRNGMHSRQNNTTEVKNAKEL